QILHGDERLALRFSKVMNGADVWMVQRRRRLRLPLETRQCMWIFRHAVGEEFQRDIAVQTGIFGLVNYTHPSTAQLLDDVVVGKLTSGKGIQRADLVRHGKISFPFTF